MEFSGKEGSVLAYPKTGYEAVILGVKTFLCEYKQSNLSTGQYLLLSSEDELIQRRSADMSLHLLLQPIFWHQTEFILPIRAT